jgi:hypothetical protein
VSAQDTEAIRAARERTPAEILATGAAWVTESELARLVARLEAAEQALRYIAGYDVAGYDAHLRSEDVARAALAAAAPGETTLSELGQTTGRTEPGSLNAAPGETEQTP